MTVICLVRHGETDWNRERRIQGREDIELNPNGIRQATLCAEHLGKDKWDAIVSSPLKRASKTAEIISGKTGIRDIEFMFDLVERDYGEVSGMTVQERDEKFPSGVIKGIEEIDALKERGMRVLNVIADKYKGKRVIAVSHGGIINAMLWVVSKGEIGTGITFLKNACMNIVKQVDGEWIIESYNQTAW